MTGIVYPNADQPLISRENNRVLQNVRTKAREIRRYLKSCKRKLVLGTTTLGGTIGLEYYLGLSFIQDVAWNLDETKAAFVAGIVPLTAFAAHQLIGEGVHEVRKGLKAYALVGAAVLPLAMSLGLGVNIATEAVNDGGSTITGSIGGADFSGGADAGASDFAAQIIDALGAISPLLLVGAYAAAMGISFYVAHRMLHVVEDNYRAIETISDPADEVEAIYDRIADLDAQHKRERMRYAAIKRTIPTFLQERFADALFVKVSAVVRDMRTKISKQKIKTASPDLLGKVAYTPAVTVPDHINSVDDANARLAQIRDKLRPYAVINALITADEEQEV